MRVSASSCSAKSSKMSLPAECLANPLQNPATMRTRPSVKERCDFSMSCSLKKLRRLNLFSESDMKLVLEESRGTDTLLLSLHISRAAFVLIARAPALIDGNTYQSKTTHVLKY